MLTSFNLVERLSLKTVENSSRYYSHSLYLVNTTSNIYCTFSVTSTNRCSGYFTITSLITFIFTVNDRGEMVLH